MLGKRQLMKPTTRIRSFLFVCGVIAGSIGGSVLTGMFMNRNSNWSHAHARTASQFRDVLLTIGDDQDDGGIPISTIDFVDWYREIYFGGVNSDVTSDGCVDFENRRIVDEWNEDVLLISIDGRFAGFGSVGPDGTWQWGRGDDLVLTVATPNEVGNRE